MHATADQPQLAFPWVGAPLLWALCDGMRNGVDNVGMRHALCDGRLQGLAIPHDDGAQVIDHLHMVRAFVLGPGA